MAKCNFCRATINPGRGKTFIAKDGRALPFCSSKCDKNFKLKRNPKKVRWIRKKRKVKEQKKE